tara:strand:- start:543 stop:779 length:237 start_codon:yes stop_codon:yes gene_type:complete
MEKSLKYHQNLCIVLIALCAFLVVLYAREVRKHRTPDNFNLDYQIDLKPKGYTIIDQDNQTYYIKSGNLEEWFLDDNL